jgi:hypothetical protein
MSDVRRAMVWLLVLAAIVIAGDHLAAIVLRQVLLRSQFRYSRLYRGGNDADIIILGDSRGVHSFYAPALEEMTGHRVLNLSYNSMSPPIAETLLMDYLDRNRAPRMVILEPTCAITSGALTSELRTYAGLSPRMAAMYATTHPAAARAARLFWLFPLNSEFFIQALHYIRRSDQDWIIRETIPPVLRERSYRWPLVPGAANVEALVRMVRMLRARNIEVRLIMAPYAPNNVPQNAAGFATLLSRRTRQPVLNYTAAIGDFDLFADTVHLNERGSRELLRMLVRDGVLGMARTPTRF